MNYRLSAMMGGKLPDNNPAITDLNDPNRPMEIGTKKTTTYGAGESRFRHGTGTENGVVLNRLMGSQTLPV
jgi:hypothetical protein